MSVKETHGSSPGQKVRPSWLNSSEKTSLYSSPSSPVRLYASLGVASSMRVGKAGILGTCPVELVMVCISARFQSPSIAKLRSKRVAQRKTGSENSMRKHTARWATRQRGQ